MNYSPLYRFMLYFVEEYDRSRDWHVDFLKDNLLSIRPEIRPYYLDYFEGGFNQVFEKHRKEIYKEFGLDVE